MNTLLNDDDYIAHKEFNVIKDDVNIKLNVFFYQPELANDGNYYSCSFKLIGPEGLIVMKDRTKGYDAMQALTLAFNFVFDLIDIHIDKIISKINKK